MDKDKILNIILAHRLSSKLDDIKIEPGMVVQLKSDVSSRKVKFVQDVYDSDSGRKALCEWFNEEGEERNLFGGEFLVSDLIIWDGNTHVS